MDLAVEILGDGRLHGYSEALGLYVCWEDGELRFFDAVTKNYLRSHPGETTRAVTAKARVVGLEAELRHLRGE